MRAAAFLTHPPPRLTDDTQAGKTMEGNRACVFALGPAVYFLKPGSAWLIVSLHAYKEFAARNRAEGWQIALRAAWGLGMHFECAQAP
ncbi:hypothetical protein RSP795_17860 [Ralstonia solanacearum]|uniref:transporter n=1 Tax=Ralstonia solanacearum TaxID=305 RepID=UPI0007D85184|nr:transporter [Ralstonia solanacearum]OAI60386.1 hypothetical protein RSP795_17860 [Ralstonia solanacearum]